MRYKTTLRQKVILIIFGLSLSLVIVEIGLCVGGFIYQSGIRHRNRISLNKGGKYRIMCLGESMTAEGAWNSYPRQLVRILEQRLADMQFSIINKGIPGAITTLILSQLEDNLDEYNPNMVLVMMGINDYFNLTNFREPRFQIKQFIRRFKIYNLANFMLMVMREKNILKGLYLQRAEYWQDKQNYPKAEKMFRKAIEINPKAYNTYLKFANYYQERKNFVQAEEMLKKAMELKPRDEELYLTMGGFYLEQERYPLSEEILQEGLKLFRYKERFYIGLGDSYVKQGKFFQAEEMYRRALKIASDNEMPYIALANYYKSQNNLILAESYLKKAIEIKPEADISYEALEQFYKDVGESSKAENILADYIKYVRSTDNYLEITRHNYQRLKKIILQRGLKLVIVQYPRRSLKPLKELFKSTAGVIFVDNEMVFKEAINKGEYGEYFEDRFAGDFGHCTPKGNWLLANNIAETIIDECFNKEKLKGK